MGIKTFVDAILNSGNTNSEANSNLIFELDLESEIKNWTELLNSSPSFLVHFLSCNFIYDYKKSEIIYFSPSIIYLLGYDHSVFSGSDGMVKFMDLINPNDFKVYNEQIFPKDLRYLNALPYSETNGMTFSNNFRMLHSNGLYKTLLLKKCFIANPETRDLLYEIGLLIDISSIKKELSITHIIERVNKDSSVPLLTKVVTEDYFPEMHASILSAREKEILSHLAKGTKRKEVGVKLFISDNTVANHIKTILRKTHSQNIREAIDICKMNGII